jgi:hypothetical protein
MVFSIWNRRMMLQYFIKYKLENPTRKSLKHGNPTNPVLTGSEKIGIM